MKKNGFTLIAWLLATLSLSAQSVIHQISSGPGYAQFGYYNLADGASQQVANGAWDIAFSNLGPQDAGVFVNESTHTVQGQPQPGVELFDTGLFDFTQTVDAGSLTADKRLYNPEISWSEGAFNTLKDPLDPFDMGWGAYNPAAHTVEGLRVFAIKLRNGTYKKLWIDTYNGQIFHFKAADLNGANEQTYSVTKSAGNGSPLVYFSFSTTTPPTPIGWDLVFCRYITPLFDGQTYIPYSVTGVLSNHGVLTAKAIGIDPVTVDHNDYLDSLDSRLDIIGHDWKAFSNAWTVAADRAYFVKATDGKLYKLVFIDFEGSSTGTGTLERTFITQLSSTNDLPAGITDAAIFPNPTVDRISLAFTSEIDSKAQVQLLNALGQTAWSGNTAVQTGLNVIALNQLPALPAGNYTLRVQFPKGQLSRQIVVKR